MKLPLNSNHPLFVNIPPGQVELLLAYASLLRTQSNLLQSLADCECSIEEMKSDIRRLLVLFQDHDKAMWRKLGFGEAPSDEDLSAGVNDTSWKQQN